MELKQADLFQFNPIYNATDHLITIHRLNLDYEVFETFELSSREFTVFGQAEGTIFQVDNDGKCQERFMVERSSYLMVH